MGARRKIVAGIDFGTSNSSVGIYDGSKISLLPLDTYHNNPEIVKTILYITRDQKPYIGQEAVQLYYKQNIGRSRHFVKVKAGQIEYQGGELFYVTDVYVYVDELQPGRLLQYLKTALRNPQYQGTQIFDITYPIEELVSIYLREIKAKMEALTDSEVSQIVLGRPVHLAQTAEGEKKAENRLYHAALQAGFAEIRFEFEPVAAALEYESTISASENILVFDFGGGTLDITIMRVGGVEKRHIYATGGIDIAGTTFDTAIINKKMLRHFGYESTYGPQHYPFPKDLVQSVSDWLVLPSLGTFATKNLIDKAILSSDHPGRLENLKSLIFNEFGFSFYNLVEQAKIALSSEYCSTIDFKNDGISIWQMITRSQFEAIIESYVKSVKDCLTETLDHSGLKASEINRVITTGGSSGIPVFNQMLKQIFGAEKLKQANLFTSVTGGLAIKAYETFCGK
jgi:hypothetical chaperone protein